MHVYYERDLMSSGAGTVSIVQLTSDRQLEPTDLGNADGIFVGGGLTPGYHRAMMRVRTRCAGSWHLACRTRACLPAP